MLNATALRYFHAVSDTGSIAAAAEQLNVAGSAVSRQIRMLENEVMADLFERQPRGMKLTPAGKQLASYVRRSILEQKEVVEDIRSNPSELTGTINIATAEGLATSLIPSLATGFQRLHPAISIQSLTKSHDDIFRQIRYGHSDLGLSFETRSGDAVTTVMRIDCETKIFMRRGHELASHERPTFHDIAKYPIATSPGTTTRRLFEHRAAVEGVEFDVRFESNNSTSIFNYLIASNAVAFGIELSAREWIKRNELVAMPLDEPALFKRSIFVTVMMNRILPKRIVEFIKYVESESTYL